MDVDVDVNKQMQNLFNVGSIPQIEVIVKKNPDGSYLYIAPNGASTTNMENSKIYGNGDAGQLTPLINKAVAAR